MLRPFSLLTSASAILLLVLAKSIGDSKFSSSEDLTDNELATEAVAAFLSRFETLSASTADVGSFMERISLSTYALLKLGFPVGTIIAGALNVASKPQSDEYQALLKLRDSMDKKFTEMIRSIEVAEKVIGMEDKLHDYINHVHVPFEELRRQTELFWNPSVEKSANEVEAFKTICYSPAHSQNTPLGILDYIYMHTVRHCSSGLYPHQISLLAEFVPLLRKISMRLSSEFDRERFDENAPGLTIWFTELDSKAAKKLLVTMQQSIDVSSVYESAQEALDVVKGMLFESGSGPVRNSMCLLQDIITGKNYQRKSIDELLNIIRLDVLQLMTFGPMCANLTFGGSPSRMLWFQNEIAKKVVAIVDHIQLYTSVEMEKTFPKIEIGVLKAKLDQMHPMAPFDNATIFMTTVEVFNALNEYGNRKYQRQGFITPTLQNDTDFTLRCYSENCFALFDYNGFNLVVTRYDMDNDEIRAVDAYEWLFKFDPHALTNAARVLETFIETYYNIDKVSSLLDRFERRHFPLTNGDFFHNVAILRSSGSTRQCAVQAVAFHYPLGNFTESCAVKYYFGGSIWHDCESFVVFFFV